MLMATTALQATGSKRKRVIQELHRKIELLLNADDKDYLHYVLKEYSTYKDVDQFVLALCSCLDNPRKLNLLPDVRKVVPSAHLLRFDKLAPYHLMEDPYLAPSASIRSKPNVRTVSLVSKPDESLGFSIRGGREHGLGVFVSQVDKDSVAYRCGLRTGDRLVEVNGVPFDRIAHSSAVRVLKSERSLKIKVQSTGRVPARQQESNSYTWLDSEGRPLSDTEMNETTAVADRLGARRSVGSGPDLRQIQLTRPGTGLGFSIRGGREFDLGIYVSNVEEGSVAAANGLRTGDQIIDVSGTNFFNIQHDLAVQTLRTASSLVITVIDAGRVPNARLGQAQTRWIRYNGSFRGTRHSVDGSRLSPGSQSVSLSLPDMRSPDPSDLTESSSKGNEITPTNSKSKREGRRRSFTLASLPAALKAGGQRLAGSIVRRTSSLRRSRSNSEGRTLDDIRLEHETAMERHVDRRLSTEREQPLPSDKRVSPSGSPAPIARSPSVFSRGVGSQVMWTTSQDGHARSMLEDAVGRALGDEERAAFMLHIHRYENEQNIQNLVVSILPILNTAQKLVLLKELRPLLAARHIDKFDELVTRKEARVLRERVRPAVGPGAEAGQAVAHSQLMAAIQGQGKKMLKKTNSLNAAAEGRRDGDGDGSEHRGRMGVFASSSALTVLEKASQMEVSPQLRRRDSFLAWKDESPDRNRRVQAVTRTGLPQVIVELKKTRPNLGLVIDGGVDTSQPQVSIQAVKEDSMAADDGFLKPGFEIVAVDGSQVKGRTHAEAVKIISLAVASDKTTIELVVIPTSEY